MTAQQSIRARRKAVNDKRYAGSKRDAEASARRLRERIEKERRMASNKAKKGKKQ